MLRYRNRREAAAYLTERGLKTSPNTLTKMATTGGGPVYQIYGNKAVYTEPNLDAYAEAKLSPPRSSTAEAHEAA
jgi:hypothetical protein